MGRGETFEKSQKLKGVSQLCNFFFQIQKTISILNVVFSI